jgi:hypothetical protein
MEGIFGPVFQSIFKVDSDVLTIGACWTRAWRRGSSSTRWTTCKLTSKEMIVSEKKKQGLVRERKKVKREKRN